MGVDWNVSEWLMAIDTVTKEQIIAVANKLQADTTFILTSQENN